MSTSATEYTGDHESVEVTFDADDGAIESVRVWNDLEEGYVSVDMEKLSNSLRVKLERFVQSKLHLYEREGA